MSCRQLNACDEGAEQLVSLALSLVQAGDDARDASQSRTRVVLKRPAEKGWQPSMSPTHVFKGKSSRYELFGV